MTVPLCVEVLAPVLLEYEVAAILRKAVAAGWLTTDLAVEALREISALNLCSVPSNAALYERALRWAERLGQSRTYDAHYLALAEQEGCTLWTADRRLARGAQQIGAHWVRWIGEVEGTA
jgi:predicted nucleic acid-binding protein